MVCLIYCYVEWDFWINKIAADHAVVAASLGHVRNLVIVQKRTNLFSVSTEFVQMMTAK